MGLNPKIKRVGTILIVNRKFFWLCDPRRYAKFKPATELEVSSQTKFAGSRFYEP